MSLPSRQILVLLLLTVSFLLSCNDKNTQRQDAIRQSGNTELIQDSLKAIVQIVFKNSEELNLEKALMPFLTTADFLFISNTQMLTFQDLKKSESEYFSTIRKQSFNFSYQHFEIINQDNAIGNLIGTLTVIQKDGLSQKYNIAETIIFKKINGIWKIVGGHESYVSDK